LTLKRSLLRVFVSYANSSAPLIPSLIHNPESQVFFCSLILDCRTFRERERARKTEPPSPALSPRPLIREPLHPNLRSRTYCRNLSSCTSGCTTLRRRRHGWTHRRGIGALRSIVWTQGRWTGSTGRAAENVVREMDSGAVERGDWTTFSGGRTMRCVAISMLSASASSLLRVFGAMIRRCRTRCLRLCVLEISRVRSDFVVVHTNRDAPRASADPFSSRGPRFVSSFSMTLRLLRCYVTA
jgi:hypothetical protein